MHSNLIAGVLVPPLLISRKKMKHPAIVLFTMLLCMLTVSCRKDDDPTYIDVAGSWTMTEQSKDDGKTWAAWTLVPTTVVLNADSRFYTDGFFGEYNGRWTRDGNVITATTTDGVQIRYRFESISGNTATMRITTLYGSMWAKAVKQ